MAILGRGGGGKDGGEGRGARGGREDGAQGYRHFSLKNNPELLENKCDQSISYRLSRALAVLASHCLFGTFSNCSKRAELPASSDCSTAHLLVLILVCPYLSGCHGLPAGRRPQACPASFHQT